ncbi:hypothetical protein FRC17_006281 [Serendipita sp. 399]|nr:hypothetical protein FRC17_006281 [Serendipita sp. 399]
MGRQPPISLLYPQHNILPEANVVNYGSEESLKSSQGSLQRSHPPDVDLRLEPSRSSPSDDGLMSCCYLPSPHPSDFLDYSPPPHPYCLLATRGPNPSNKESTLPRPNIGNTDRNLVHKERATKGADHGSDWTTMPSPAQNMRRTNNLRVSTDSEESPMVDFEPSRLAPVARVGDSARKKMSRGARKLLKKTVDLLLRPWQTSRL